MVPIITVGLALWLNRTTFGKAVTASADNAPLARLAGIRPRTVSTIVWVMSGLLATLTMSLLSSGGPTTGVQNLGYGTLNLALVAAVIAGMRSFPRAMLGGIFIGLLSGLVTWWRLWDVVDQGFASFVFFGIVFIAVWRQARSTDDELMAFTPKVPPIPDHVREIWWIRNLSRLAVTAALLVVAAITWFHGEPSPHRHHAVALLPVHDRGRLRSVRRVGHRRHRLVRAALARPDGLRRPRAGSWPTSCTSASRSTSAGANTRLLDFQHRRPRAPGRHRRRCCLITAAIAALTGIGALRVPRPDARRSRPSRSRSPRSTTSSSGRSSPAASGRHRFPRGSIFGLDLCQRARRISSFSLARWRPRSRSLILNRLRNGAIGRRILAVRDNPDTASAYTVSPTRTKLLAFALAGFVAGLAGGLFANLLPTIRYAEAHFLINDSRSRSSASP